MLRQIAYTNIILSQSGRVSRDSDELRAFMALSISITTRMESETVLAALAFLFEADDDAAVGSFLDCDAQFAVESWLSWMKPALTWTVLDESRLSYIARSRYHEQLTRFLEHYPMERILILEQDELFKQRRETLQRVFRFIGVRDDFWRESFNNPKLRELPLPSPTTASRNSRSKPSILSHPSPLKTRIRSSFSTMGGFLSCQSFQ